MELPMGRRWLSVCGTDVYVKGQDGMVRRCLYRRGGTGYYTGMQPPKQRIKSFSVMHTARFAAVLLGILAVVVSVPFGAALLLASLFAATGIAAYSPILVTLGLVGLPVAAAVGGFVLTAITCGLYNALAERFGGIEVELKVAPGVLTSRRG